MLHATIIVSVHCEVLNVHKNVNLCAMITLCCEHLVSKYYIKCKQRVQFIFRSVAMTSMVLSTCPTRYQDCYTPKISLHGDTFSQKNTAVIRLSYYIEHIPSINDLVQYRCIYEYRYCGV